MGRFLLYIYKIDGSKYEGEWKDNQLDGIVYLVSNFLRGYIVGLMVEDMKEVGKIVICTVKVNIPGKMGDITKVIISMIKK